MKLTIYDYSRAWFNWCFENPSKINSNHSALFFFCLEHCNRLGWKNEFGLPTTMAKEAIGIHSYNTYIKTLNDLIDFGFIKLKKKSTNQFSSNIVALSISDKATVKALDKAIIKHDTKQISKQHESTSSILIQDTNIPITNKQIYREFDHLKISIVEYEKLLARGFINNQIDDVINKIQNYKKNTNYVSLYLTALDWLKREYPNTIEVAKQKNELKNINDYRKIYDIPIKEEYEYQEKDIIEFCKQGKYPRL